MTARLKFPNYLLPETITIDPNSDEVYIVRSPREDSEDLTKRLSRNTFSSESKLYPWSKPVERIWRKAVIVNRNPTFECVSKNKALSITERVSRPTKSSKIRRNEDLLSSGGSFTRLSTRDSSAGSSTTSHRQSSASASLGYEPVKPVPRASARPERSILRTPASRHRSRNSSATTGKTPPRNVRFQSPLPPMPPQRVMSRTSIFSNSGDEATSSVTSISSAPNRLSSPKKKCQNKESDDEDDDSTSNEAKKPTENNKENVNNENISKKNGTSNNRATSPKKMVENRGNNNGNNFHRVSSPKKTGEGRENSGDTRNKSRSPLGSPTRRKKDHQSSGKVSSPENKNMEMVLNFFSKLPPV